MSEEVKDASPDRTGKVISLSCCSSKQSSARRQAFYSINEAMQTRSNCCLWQQPFYWNIYMNLYTAKLTQRISDSWTRTVNNQDDMHLCWSRVRLCRKNISSSTSERICSAWDTSVENAVECIKLPELVFDRHTKWQGKEWNARRVEAMGSNSHSMTSNKRYDTPQRTENKWLSHLSGHRQVLVACPSKKGRNPHADGFRSEYWKFVLDTHVGIPSAMVRCCWPGDDCGGLGWKRKKRKREKNISAAFIGTIWRAVWQLNFTKSMTSGGLIELHILWGGQGKRTEIGRRSNSGIALYQNAD